MSSFLVTSFLHIISATVLCHLLIDHKEICNPAVFSFLFDLIIFLFYFYMFVCLFFVYLFCCILLYFAIFVCIFFLLLMLCWVNLFSLSFSFHASQYSNVKITTTCTCDIKRHEINRLDSSRS